jgi:hypothetical protein
MVRSASRATGAAVASSRTIGSKAPASTAGVAPPHPAERSGQSAETGDRVTEATETDEAEEADAAAFAGTREEPVAHAPVPQAPPRSQQDFSPQQAPPATAADFSPAGAARGPVGTAQRGARAAAASAKAVAKAMKGRGLTARSYHARTARGPRLTVGREGARVLLSPITRRSIDD